MTPNKTKLELIVGTFVLAGLLAVACLAFKIGAGVLLGSQTYLIQARFTNVGGLNPGSDVLISGVSVGRVETIRLNPDYSAIAELRLRDTVKVPADSTASIKTSGLIGDKYLSLIPGGDTRMLGPNGIITDTLAAIDLESLISRMAFGAVQNPPPKESK